jgi:uncharacterized protein (DUF885 family)
MQNILKSLFAVAIIAAMGCSGNQGQVKTEHPIDSLFEAFSEEQLRFYPILATKAGDSRYNHLLPNHIDSEYLGNLKVFYEKYRNALLTYDKTTFSENQRMSYDVLMWECDINLEAMDINPGLILVYDGKGFSFSYMPIDQFWSTNLIIGQLAGGTAMQPFKTVKDYENWLSRVADYMIWCDTAIANMRKGMDSGVVLPDVLVKKIIPQMENFAKGPVQEHVFYKPVSLFPNHFSDTEKQRLSALYFSMVEEKVMPMYDKLHRFFKDEYLKAARQSTGFDALPNGNKAYQYLVKYFTTTSLSPDEIYQIGLQEVDRIHAEIEKVKQKLAFKGDLKAFFEHVRTNKALMPFTDPRQVIDNFDAIHEKMKPNLARLFDVNPKTAFEVMRTEAFREKTASAQYFPGSMDGSRPGIFYIPIPDVKNYNVFGDEVLFLHEAIPGHHYQISLQQEDTRLPGFRRMLWQSAYGEGWALYTEYLGTELGLYTDPYQYFGMLSSELHRALRLVVDVGLHAKGWDRGQAIDYLLKNSPKARASVESEVERYMALPAQALSYKIGQLKLIGLRKKAEKELGDEFNIIKFHRVMLEPGCIPLQLLEERIERWIVEQKGAKQ